MLDSIRQAGKNIGRELNRAWENLSDGWRELVSRNNQSLTLFELNQSELPPQDESAYFNFPRWGIVPCEIIETETDILVQVEIPGIRKEDCSIRLEGGTLYVSGEKHFRPASEPRLYHVMERAYGTFERRIPLPRHVKTDGASANYADGILTISLPRAQEDKVSDIPIS